MIPTKELLSEIARASQGKEYEAVRANQARRDLVHLIASRQGRDRSLRLLYEEQVVPLEQQAVGEHEERFSPIGEIIQEQVFPMLLAIRNQYAPGAPVFQADRYENVYDPDRNTVNTYQRALLTHLPSATSGYEFLFGMHVVAHEYPENSSYPTAYRFAAQYYNMYKGEEQHLFDEEGMLASIPEVVRPLPIRVTPPSDIFQFSEVDGQVTYTFGPSRGLVAPSVVQPHSRHTVDLVIGRYNHQRDVRNGVEKQISEAFAKTGLAA